MLKYKVRTEGEALAYLLDCTLATVAAMAMTKSRKKGEYARQVSIAQTGVNWLKANGWSAFDTRAKEVIEQYDGIVANWVEQYDVLVIRD